MIAPTAILLALLSLTPSAIAGGEKQRCSPLNKHYENYAQNIGMRYKEECIRLGLHVSNTGACRVSCDHLPTYYEWANIYNLEKTARKKARLQEREREKQRMAALAKKLGLPPLYNTTTPDPSMASALPVATETVKMEIEPTSPEEPAKMLSPRGITAAPTPTAAAPKMANTPIRPCKPEDISAQDSLCTLARKIPRYAKIQAALSSSLQAAASTLNAKASSYRVLLNDAKATAVDKTATVTATVEKLVTKCISSSSSAKASTTKTADSDTTPTPTARSTSAKKQTKATRTTSSVKPTRTIYVTSEGSSTSIMWSMLVAWIGIQVLFLTVM
ncbi:hypothetical protein HER10_EVM0010808 [Colletotrichum scovillei]|uniref:Uncharacterized protein n=1 Tax=Colletotrichum scovillei TaxID=1209932 RepID=A0A9P7UJX2_9PEZI|nr:uncharacterized protein HER10_EVM0010808 [Colletotrichum scovillei]KAF4780289.1 hypothetical protein HER10_EVM0010808 [Colletotrichum scovillei]KAG7057113.1 hypothetical protein JMJ77_0004505 [Colletotrichum scovillei]KAG7075713.1 hypothetical protein JMJ76_0012990 [Colletotrichum scovillei]KAG7082910.1 hypothetical protein JMJ78_0008363 [Colletotrichum scovillei]